ncbi:SDR family oxidoreductase [Devosia alba]|uniref:SDR family oxidoreductase n=1 Tax=Devosia alba TaxID=3152360 RepID=UPI0032651F7C
MNALGMMPLPDLRGKVALITGAGRGIGRAAAELLLQAGATVFAGVRENETVEGAVTLLLDVTDASSVAAAFAAINQQVDHLDVLINNAGIVSPIGHVDDVDAEAFAIALNVNIAGPLRVAQAALPLLRAAKGVIINAGSGAAFSPLEGWAAYCTSKAGLTMLSRVIDLENSGQGIKSFTLGIPPTNTEMQGVIRSSGLNPVSQIPKENLVAPAIPASVMVWLCGDEARGIAELTVDVRDDRFRALMA